MNYDPTTKLYDLPDHEFETGGLIGEAVKKAGYIDGGRAVINQQNLWNWTLGQALSSFAAQTAQ